MSWPHRVGVVPPLADCRQQRPADLDLQTATAAGQTVVVCQVLSGLGGVGKTQLAAGLAHRMWESRQVDLLVWVTATSRDSIVTSYAQAAVDVTGVDDPDPAHAVGRFLAWLSEPHDRHWLIVLDDLANPGDLNGLWPPTTDEGRTVVTTRRRDAALTGHGRHMVDVGLFTPEEATAYLLQKLAGRGQQHGQVEGLAEDLGYLPLALAQAAAYMIDRGLDCAAYRQRFAGQRRRLSDLLPEPGALPDEHRATVAVTWSLSVELADQLAPTGLARPALDLASVLDPNGIPAQLFTTPAILDYLADQCTCNNPGERRAVPSEDAVDALHALQRLTLITLDTRGAVRIHGLLQRATRDQFPGDHLARVALVVADALLQVWPDSDREPILSQALRANVGSLNHQAAKALLIPNAHPVLFRAGTSLGQVGQFSAATNYFEQLLSECLQALGPDHPNTLATRHSMVYWRGQAGDAPGAMAAMQELLSDYLQTFDYDHPVTLNVRKDLALWRGHAGDVAGATTEFRTLLRDFLRVLGHDHPDSLTIRHALADWQGETGDATGAVTAYEELLVDRLRVLGPDSPDTLTTRHLLAHWRGAAGNASGAVAAYEELLPDRLRVLGPDHPDTLSTRHFLAYWRGQSGDAAGAAICFEKVLSDRLRVLGPDHPHCMVTRVDLARWRGETGDIAGAITAFEQLLTDRRRILGPDHPDTLGTRADLIYWKGKAGDIAGAIAASEVLLADRLRILGPDNPSTLASRAEMARWQGEGGDPTGAAAAYEALLADRLRILGPEHPDTLSTHAKLARCREACNADSEQE